MLVIPFLFGLFTTRPVAIHALLFVFWLIAYLFTFPFLQWIKTKKLHLYKGPMMLYGSLFGALGMTLAIIAPSLLRWVPIFIPFFLINCWYARNNRERSFVNDLAAVLLFSMMVYVSHDVGSLHNWQIAHQLFLLSIVYFIGTVFYVKTIIREKHNKIFYWYSVLYHLAAVIVSAVWYPWLVTVSLAILLVRAAWAPRTKITVKRSGILEIIYAVWITVAVFLTYGL